MVSMAAALVMALFIDKAVETSAPAVRLRGLGFLLDAASAWRPSSPLWRRPPSLQRPPPWAMAVAASSCLAVSAIALTRSEHAKTGGRRRRKRRRGSRQRPGPRLRRASGPRLEPLRRRLRLAGLYARGQPRSGWPDEGHWFYFLLLCLFNVYLLR